MWEFLEKRIGREVVVDVREITPIGIVDVTYKGVFEGLDTTELGTFVILVKPKIVRTTDKGIELKPLEKDEIRIHTDRISLNAEESFLGWSDKNNFGIWELLDRMETWEHLIDKKQVHFVRESLAKIPASEVIDYSETLPDGRPELNIPKLIELLREQGLSLQMAFDIAHVIKMEWSKSFWLPALKTVIGILAKIAEMELEET